jgi:hypothetical protein
MQHLLSDRNTIELAEQRIPVFLGPVSQMRDERFDLFPRDFAQGLYTAEVSCVRLDQTRIEAVLAKSAGKCDQGLSRAAIVSVGRVGRRLRGSGAGISDVISLFAPNSDIVSAQPVVRCWPTRLAQYSTSSRSSSLKAARKWLSISSSPTTLPRTKMGTTISDLVSCEHAR